MLYLQNTTDPQVLQIPNNGVTPSGDLTFIAKSTIDLSVKIDTWMADLQTSALYYNLSVILPEDLPAGEYEYTLLDGEEILSTGLLVICELNKPSEYNKEIQYEQYESE